MVLVLNDILNVITNIPQLIDFELEFLTVASKILKNLKFNMPHGAGNLKVQASRLIIQSNHEKQFRADFFPFLLK